MKNSFYGKSHDVYSSPTLASKQLRDLGPLSLTLKGWHWHFYRKRAGTTSSGLGISGFHYSVYKIRRLALSAAVGSLGDLFFYPVTIPSSILSNWEGRSPFWQFSIWKNNPLNKKENCPWGTAGSSLRSKGTSLTRDGCRTVLFYEILAWEAPGQWSTSWQLSPYIISPVVTCMSEKSGAFFRKLE